jgi:uncharacterized SAM-binding protein YcdF (DUF218 family)
LSDPLTDRERFIACLAGMSKQKADALVLFQGDGHARVPYAVELFRQGWADFVILVGGADDRDYGSYPSAELYELLRAAGVPAGAIRFEPTALHTRAEIDSALDIAGREGWKRLLLVTSPYHIFRVMLSFAAAVRQSASPVMGYPAVIPCLSLFARNAWGARADLYDKEFARIATYQAKGDVASFAEGLDYLMRADAP